MASPSLRAHWPLAFSVTAVSALSYWTGGTQSYWIDEIFSVELALRGQSGAWGIFAYAGGADVHPPGYYLFLAAWGALVGVSEPATRLAAVLLGGICGPWPPNWPPGRVRRPSFCRAGRSPA